MRERLNNDPKFQIAFFGIAVVAIGLILMIQLGGGAAQETTTDPAATTPAPGTDPATGTDPAAGGTATGTATTDPAATDPAATGTATPPATGTTTPPAAAGGTDAMLPTKGLPEDVLVAYAKKQPVVLLVVNPNAPGTPRLERYADRLEGYKDAAVFKVPTKKVAKYSRITEGVAINQTPAIVVVTPRNVSAGGPTASVTYGVRNENSFRQAIDDAVYDGGTRPAYP